MIILSNIRLHNWLRYRGVHQISLNPTFYGVTAKWHHNDRRSNGGGKSGLMEAIQFVLYGRHRHRTEDEWICRGESEGGVRLYLQDGEKTIQIDRERKIGKSTKLILRMGGKTLLGDEAQLEIERLIGLSPDDFENSVYFEQKRMSRFITDDPGDRMKVVVGWLRLEPIEQAAKSVGDQLSSVLNQISGIEQNHRACNDLLKQIVEQSGCHWEGDYHQEFEANLDVLDEQIETSKKNVTLFNNQLRMEKDSARDFQDAKEYHRVVGEGKALRKKVEEYHPTLPTQEDLKDAEELMEANHKIIGTLEKQVEEKKVLVKGEFDGVCPVAGIKCPATKEINSDFKRNQSLLERFKGKLSKSMEEAERVATHLGDVEEKLDQYDQDLKERERLKEECLRLKPAADRVLNLKLVENSSTEEDLKSSKDHLFSLESKYHKLKASIDLIDRQQAILEKAKEEIHSLHQKADLLREAHNILGRDGAQRRIAESALQKMEKGANHALSRCSIDLQTTVSWSRETKGLAKTCVDCGAAYPVSRKVKNCEKCGALRGPHLDHKLEIIPSDRSGGFDDLAGITVQLAAADWLRKDRQSGCGFVLLDEPLAALDAEHKKSFAGHLPGLLRHFGFSQGIISAHDSSIMNGMPAIIEIEALENGSKFVNEEEVQDGDEDSNGNQNGDRCSSDSRLPKSKGSSEGSPRVRRRRTTRAVEEDHD